MLPSLIFNCSQLHHLSSAAHIDFESFYQQTPSCKLPFMVTVLEAIFGIKESSIERA